MLQLPCSNSMDTEEVNILDTNTKQVKLCVVLLLRAFIMCFSVCLPTKGYLDKAWFLLFSLMLAAAQKEKAQVVSK